MAVADILKKIFGSKSDRDMKAIRPVLDKILAVYPEIDKLTNDELRARSAALRTRIAEVEKPFEDRIAQIKLEMNRISRYRKKKPLLQKATNWSRTRMRPSRSSSTRSFRKLSPS